MYGENIPSQLPASVTCVPFTQIQSYEPLLLTHIMDDWLQTSDAHSSTSEIKYYGYCHDFQVCM